MMTKIKTKMMINNQPLNKEENHKLIKTNLKVNHKEIKIIIKEIDHKVITLVENLISIKEEIKVDIKEENQTSIINSITTKAVIITGKTKVEIKVATTTGKTIKEAINSIIIKAEISKTNLISTDHDLHSFI